MCLGIPVQVLECGEFFARCQGRPEELRTWLLCFLDAAREVIPAERALAINSALAALEAVGSGETNFDAFFADLNREPQLPEFLRTAKP